MIPTTPFDKKFEEDLQLHKPEESLSLVDDGGKMAKSIMKHDVRVLPFQGSLIIENFDEITLLTALDNIKNKTALSPSTACGYRDVQLPCFVITVDIGVLGSGPKENTTVGQLV